MSPSKPAMPTLGVMVMTLTADKKKFEDDISSYKAGLVITRKEATEARFLIQKLSEQNSKYRGIILKGSSDKTEIADNDIHSQSVKIRDLVQCIVHRYYAVQGDRKLASYNDPYFEDQQRFRDMLKGLASDSLQKFCLWGRIFGMVHSGLVSRQFEHGLKDSEEALDCSEAGTLWEVILANDS
ncbi:MAG: hypothetical protein Q9184_007520 [Pyrenodesmia sp. 2 TL-2023]